VIDGGAEFAALRLANEGGTHGPVGTYVVTGWPSTYPSRAQNSAETFQKGVTRGEPTAGAGYSRPPMGSRPLRRALRIFSRSSRSVQGGSQRAFHSASTPNASSTVRAKPRTTRQQV